MRVMKLIAAATVVCAPMLLTACNTVSGAGKDVAVVGQGLTDTAKTVQQKLP